MTIAEMMVEIGADVSGFERSTRQVERDFQKMGSSVQDMAKSTGQSVKGLSGKWRLMSDEMKNAYRSANAALIPFKKDLLGVEYDYFKLSQSMKTYKGSTQDFMGEVSKLGKQHKKITEDMMKNNELMKSSFIQSVGTMLNRSGQSEKIAANFERMNNPLYKVNNGLLGISNSLERVARNGNASVLALKMLGPTANMKQLNDMTRMINQGLMRFTMVSVIAAAGAAIFYGALHKGAKETVKGYEETFGKMVSTVRKAFQPMVEVFAAIMMPIYEFITAIADMVVKFNEAHPIIAKIVAAFMLLLPALTLILAPLAIGIGLFGGLQAALSAVWMIIGPVVVGFATMMGTVLLVAAVIVAVGAALYLLWTKTTWFKDAVLTAWEFIKTGTQIAWDFILNSILLPIWNAILTFGKEILTKFQEFWAENGESIKGIVQGWLSAVWSNIQMVMGIIKGIFQAVWPIISGIVKIAWNVIKTTVKSVLDIVMGLITAGMKILEGDWSGAWDSIKGIAEDIWHNIEDFFSNIDLYEIGKDIIQGLIDGIGSMAGAVADKVASIAKSIPNGVKDFLGIHSPSRLMRDDVGRWIPEGMAVGIERNIGVVTKSASAMSQAAIPSVSSMSMDVGVKRSFTDSSLSSIEAGNQSASGNTYNLRGLLEGAVFHVREEADIEKIAIKLGKLTKSRARQNGVVY